MASPFLFLARTLHQKEFSAVIKKDINRINDGRLLRQLFLDEQKFRSNGDRDRALDEISIPECSVLELLIGIAERLNFMYLDSQYDKPVGDWMHELLSNLKLGYMTDAVLVEFPEYLQKAMRIMDQLIERTYEADGRGGLFPLDHPKRDQREVEIWEQMADYCAENYDMDSEKL